MATVKLEVLSWLTRVFDKEQRVRLIREEVVNQGTTVRDLFNQLTDRYPEFGELVYNPNDQELTGMVSIIFNDRILELTTGGLDTEIHDGDSIVLLPAYSGGSQNLSPSSKRNRERSGVHKNLLRRFPSWHQT